MFVCELTYVFNKLPHISKMCLEISYQFYIDDLVTFKGFAIADERI